MKPNSEILLENNKKKTQNNYFPKGIESEGQLTPGEVRINGK